MFIATAIFILALALLLAFLEIEVEGGSGWAENLPTWYRKSRVFYYLNGRKPLTGYHLFLLAFMLLAFHAGFFTGLAWSLPAELLVVSYYMIFLTVEDFLWFAFNPKFGSKNFKKDRIWWHNENAWVFGLFPLSYLSSVVITVLLNTYSSFYSGSTQVLYDYLYFLGALTVLVIAVSLIFPPFYFRWYRAMRKRDDRGKFNIFH